MWITNVRYCEEGKETDWDSRLAWLPFLFILLALLPTANLMTVPASNSFKPAPFGGNSWTFSLVEYSFWWQDEAKGGQGHSILIMIQGKSEYYRVCPRNMRGSADAKKNHGVTGLDARVPLYKHHDHNFKLAFAKSIRLHCPRKAAVVHESGHKPWESFMCARRCISASWSTSCLGISAWACRWQRWIETIWRLVQRSLNNR